MAQSELDWEHVQVQAHWRMSARDDYHTVTRDSPQLLYWDRRWLKQEMIKYQQGFQDRPKLPYHYPERREVGLDPAKRRFALYQIQS